MKGLFLSALLLLCVGMTWGQLPGFTITQFSTGYNGPVEVVNCGDSRLFVVEQGGYIYICDSTGVMSPNPFLDIHQKIVLSSEQGLIGLAFDPDYANNRTFYIYYCHKGGNTNLTISRYKTDSLNPDVADTTEQVLMSIPHPNYYNHNGGCLRFGPDGYLYFGTGDGGSFGDPNENAQNHQKYLGKMLRIDVHGDSLYAIPPDNPFLNDSTFYPEIWAYGMRNPWRYSFDRLTNDLWIGDVGQDTWEEVDFISAIDTGGQNYGWDCYEGTHTYQPNNCNGSADITWPIAEYKHINGDDCVIGGFVYRGAQYASMFGKYFLVDNGSGEFKMITHNPDGTFTLSVLGDNLISGDGGAFTSFGEDRWGELYVCDATHGRIYKLSDTICAPVAFIIERLTDSVFCGAYPVLHAVAGIELSYQWLQDGVSLPGATNTDYAVAAPGDYQVQVTNASGCSSTSLSVQVHNPIAVSLTLQDTSFCIYQTAVPLTGNPPGGTFSGDGVSGSTFNPNAAGAGFHTLYYTYSDSGCEVVDTQQVFVDVCSGLNDSWDHTGLNIFPNPGDGLLTILLRDTGEAVEELSVFSVTGQQIITLRPVSSNQNEFVLNLHALSNGVYFLRVTLSGSTSLHKIVISH